MITLDMLKIGDCAVVCGCTDSANTCSRLESLGFVRGAKLTVLHCCGRDKVVKILNCRVALCNKLAKSLLVSEVNLPFVYLKRTSPKGVCRFGK